MNTHVVTKPLPTSSGVLEVGSPVDASRWRNARLLEEQRYIKPLAQGTEKKSEKRSNN